MARTIRSASVAVTLITMSSFMSLSCSSTPQSIADRESTESASRSPAQVRVGIVEELIGVSKRLNPELTATELRRAVARRVLAEEELGFLRKEIGLADDIGKERFATVTDDQLDKIYKRLIKTEDESQLALVGSLMKNENFLRILGVKSEELGTQMKSAYQQVQEAISRTKSSYKGIGFKDFDGLGNGLERRATTRPPSLGSASKLGEPASVGVNVGHKAESLPNDVIKGFTSDLTMQARAGELKKGIALDKTIDRAFEVMGQLEASNPLFSGPAGVGKTTLAETIAIRFAEGRVPPQFKGMRVLKLDLGKIMSGSAMRGELEAKVAAFVEAASDGKTFVFIDEIHMLMKAGKGDGSIGIVELLKENLANGKLKIIGATTSDELRHVLADPAVARRFTEIDHAPPTVPEAIEIMKKAKVRYEDGHMLIIPNDAAEEAVRYSEPYATQIGVGMPALPMKVLDRAGAKVSLELTKNPEAIRLLEERASLWADYREELKFIKQAEKAGDTTLKNKLANGAFKKIDARLRQLDQEIEHLAGRSVRVTPEDVRAVVNDMAKAPRTAGSPEEIERILNSANLIKTKAIGQESAALELEEMNIVLKSGTKDPNKPYFFIVTGEKGVGRSTLIQAEVDVLYQDPKKLLEIDLSKYQARESLNTLIGSPTGYVGSEEGGLLSEFIKRNPFSVVSFKNFEKASPEIQDLIMGMISKGSFNDGMGRTIEARNCLIALETDAGAKAIGKLPSKDEELLAIRTEMEKLFGRSDVGNAANKIISCNTLDQESFQKIADMQFAAFKSQMAFEKKLGIDLSPDALEHIGVEAFKAQKLAGGGGNKVSQIISNEVRPVVGRELLKKTIQQGDNILIDLDAATKKFVVKKLR